MSNTEEASEYLSSIVNSPSKKSAATESVSQSKKSRSGLRKNSKSFSKKKKIQVRSSKSRSGTGVRKVLKISKKKRKKKKKKKKPPAVNVYPPAERLKAQIDKTDKENEVIRQRIRKITDTVSTGHTKSSSDLNNRLNVQADKLTVQCHHERMKIKEYEQKFGLLIRDVEKARKKYGGSLQDCEQEEILDKQLRVLENRLESHLKKYNKLLSVNREKRTEIDKLKGERKVFDKIYRKIEKELHNKQKQLSKLIENSNHAFEERERVNEDLRNIRGGIRTEERKFDKKIQIIDEILQSDFKVNQYLKQQERKKFQKNYKEKEITVEEQANIKKSFIKGNWRLAEKRAKEIILKEKILRYNKIFREIETKTNLKKEELISRLKNSQQRYYQEFIFINKLNSEIEKLEKQNEKYVADIALIEQSKKKDPDKRKLKVVQGNISKIQDAIFTFKEKQGELRDLLQYVHPYVAALTGTLGLPVNEKFSDVGLEIKRMFMRIEERLSTLMRQYYRFKHQQQTAIEPTPVSTPAETKISEYPTSPLSTSQAKVTCGSELPKKGSLKFKIKPPSSLQPIVNEIQTVDLFQLSPTGEKTSEGLPPLTREELESAGLVFQKSAKNEKN